MYVDPGKFDKTYSLHEKWYNNYGLIQKCLQFLRHPCCTFLKSSCEAQSQKLLNIVRV